METSTNKMSKRVNKRLKVGRACYTCRAKKIKCDGLRPCMQCKARQRPCSFYKDGSSEQFEKINDPPENTNTNLDFPYNDNQFPNVEPNSDSTVANFRESSTNANDRMNEEDERIFFTDSTDPNHVKLRRRGPLMETRVSHSLSTLGENFKKLSSTDNTRLANKLLHNTTTFGNFIMWMPEPSLPSRYSGSIEMPPRKIQMALIDHFFSERSELLGVFPRFYFDEQLEKKGLFITPLLLNIMYAHSARFVSLPDCPKSEIFFHRAKRLVDDFLDVPRTSTVLALCLLANYEPSPEIYRPGTQHCRQWQYSGMANRMALELGLNDDSHVHSSLSLAEIEIRRRIFWGCYESDKYHSAGWERPWMIFKNTIKTKYPSPLPNESKQDAINIEVFASRINFAANLEESLFLSFNSKKNPIPDNHIGAFSMSKEELLSSWDANYTNHQQWLHSLKSELQWTPTPSVSINHILELAPPFPKVAQLHLLYNTTILDVLPHVTPTPLTQYHARTTATCLTQIVHFLCQRPSVIHKFDMIVHAIILAIRVHIIYLDDPDITVAQQAWFLFDRCIWCLQTINNIAVIPNANKFLQQVQSIYGSDSNSSNKPVVQETNEENITTSTQPPPAQYMTKQFNTQSMVSSPSTSLKSKVDRNRDITVPSSSTISFSNELNQISNFISSWASNPTPEPNPTPVVSSQQQQIQEQSHKALQNQQNQRRQEDLQQGFHPQASYHPQAPHPQTSHSQNIHSQNMHQNTLHQGIHHNNLHQHNLHQQSSQTANALLNLGMNTNPNRTVLYLDHHYGFAPPTSSTIPQQIPSYNSLSTIKRNTENQTLWSSREKQYNLPTGNRDTLTYNNNGDIIIPSQIIKSNSPSQQQRNNPSNERYEQHLIPNNTTSNMQWQHDPHSNLDMNVNHNSAGYNQKGLGMYLSSQQHCKDMIKEKDHQ